MYDDDKSVDLYYFIKAKKTPFIERDEQIINVN